MTIIPKSLLRKLSVEISRLTGVSNGSFGGVYSHGLLLAPLVGSPGVTLHLLWVHIFQ